MTDISRAYLVLGALYLCVGMTLGIGMGIQENFVLVPAHAHINLVGFACHSIFGLVGKVFPAVARDSLAKVQFWLFAIGTPILAVGVAVVNLYQNPALAIIGSILCLLGALLYLVMVARSSGKA